MSKTLFTEPGIYVNGKLVKGPTWRMRLAALVRRFARWVDEPNAEHYLGVLLDTSTTDFNVPGWKFTSEPKAADK